MLQYSCSEYVNISTKTEKDVAGMSKKELQDLQLNKEAVFKILLGYENKLSQLIADGSMGALVDYVELNLKKRIVLDTLAKFGWRDEYLDTFKDSPTQHLINSRMSEWSKSHTDKVDTLIKDIRSVKRLVGNCLAQQKEPGELYAYLMDFNVSDRDRVLREALHETPKQKSDGIKVTNSRISAIYVWGGDTEEVYTVGTEVYLDTDRGTTPVFVTDIHMEDDKCIVYGELYKQEVVLATFVNCPIRVKFCYDIVDVEEEI